ncbi:MAG: phosphatidate cytidylyltransferase, partial [Verrucomicrobiales bacterium]
LCPNISPGKTVAGALGAVIFTSVFGAVVGQMMRLPIDSTLMLMIAAALCSVSGTMGDLIISSVKRDVGIKDMSAALPGHGGILDRFDSLLLAAPCLYYFILWTHKFDTIQGTSLLSGV